MFLLNSTEAGISSDYIGNWPDAEVYIYSTCIGTCNVQVFFHFGNIFFVFVPYSILVDKSNRVGILGGVPDKRGVSG